jgi:hypothetical protein
VNSLCKYPPPERSSEKKKKKKMLCHRNAILYIVSAFPSFSLLAAILAFTFAIPCFAQAPPVTVSCAAAQISSIPTWTSLGLPLSGAVNLAANTRVVLNVPNLVLDGLTIPASSAVWFDWNQHLNLRTPYILLNVRTSPFPFLTHH